MGLPLPGQSPRVVPSSRGRETLEEAWVGKHGGVRTLAIKRFYWPE